MVVMLSLFNGILRYYVFLVMLRKTNIENYVILQVYLISTVIQQEQYVKLRVIWTNISVLDLKLYLNNYYQLIGESEILLLPILLLVGSLWKHIEWVIPWWPQWDDLGPFTAMIQLLSQHGLVIIPIIIVWDKITNRLPNFNSCTVDAWEWMRKFIPHGIGHTGVTVNPRFPTLYPNMCIYGSSFVIFCYGAGTIVGIESIHPLPPRTLRQLYFSTVSLSQCFWSNTELITDNKSHTTIIF